MYVYNTYSMVLSVSLAIPSIYEWEAVLNESEVFNYFINFSEIALESISITSYGR